MEERQNSSRFSFGLPQAFRSSASAAAAGSWASQAFSVASLGDKKCDEIVVNSSKSVLVPWCGWILWLC